MRLNGRPDKQPVSEPGFKFRFVRFLSQGALAGGGGLSLSLNEGLATTQTSECLFN